MADDEAATASVEVQQDFALGDEKGVPGWSLKERVGINKDLCVVQRGVYSDVGVGGVVWDGAVVLAELIRRGSADSDLVSNEFGKHFCMRDKRVVELGAGTGAVGLASALYGATSVVLSDVESTLAVAVENIERNKSAVAAANSACDLSARVADWRIAGSVREAVGPMGVDVVLAADCVYEGDDEGDGEQGGTGELLLNAMEEALSCPRQDKAETAGQTTPPVALVAVKRRRDGHIAIVERFMTAVTRRFSVQNMTSLVSEEHRVGVQVLLCMLPADGQTS